MSAHTLPGRATPERTQRRLSGFPAHAPQGHALFGATGLHVSRIGFGGYRVDDETPAHREALAAALAAGCNLIDTSTNYTDGGSERLVGEVLRAAARADGPPREAVVVVSKIGYVQGQNMRLAQERERSGFPFPEMVKPEEWCWHCIHPEFLKDQLGRSLERLGLLTLDVCLLHNPEYFFTEAKKHRRGRDLDVLRAEFYRRVQEAFAFFEGAVSRGEIGCYGVSSNSLVAAADDPEATSLTYFLKAAEEAGGSGHHFRVVQFPMNLFESGGALVVNTGPERRLTPLEAAADAGLAVLINRPLNAIVGKRLVRLAGAADGGGGRGLEAIRADLKALEEEYRAAIAPRSGSSSAAVEPFFDLIDQIAVMPDQIEDLEHWKQIEQQYVIPRLNHTARAMAHDVSEDVRPAWQRWWERCIRALEDLLAAIAREASRRSRSRSDQVGAAIDPLLPEERRGATLSQKSLQVVRSTPGVSCVLVGMRQVAYVEDALAVMSWPPLPGAPEVFRKLKSLRLR
jgi:uncharacterized protein